MQSYRTALSPWAVFRCLSPATNICVARFRKRNDADEYIKIIRQSIPEATFEVVFDKQETPRSGVLEL
jgi:hypothetical protein